MSSILIAAAPIFIGYRWRGVAIIFPAGYLQDGETIRATLRKRPGASGLALASARDGDTVFLTAAASDTAGLDPVLYQVDLIVEASGGDDPLNLRLFFPVERGAAAEGPATNTAAVTVTVQLAARDPVEIEILSRELSASDQLYLAGLITENTTQAMVDYLVQQVQASLPGQLDFSNPNNSDLLA